MDLKEFVKEALSQVAAGVEEAQADVLDRGGFVNPAHRPDSRSSNEAHFGVLENGQNIFLVDFDVSVTVAEETGKSGGAKLQVASFVKLGGDVDANTSSTATNRISFKVPMALPVDDVSEEQLKAQDEERREKVRRRNESRRRRNSSWMSS